MELALFAQAREVVGEYVAGEHGQGAARGGGDILVLLKQMDRQVLPVVAPNFGHAEGGVNRELGNRAVVNVNLDSDVGRRIDAEIELHAVADQRCTLHVKAGIGFETCTPPFFSHRRCPEEPDVDAQTETKRTDKPPDEPSVIFVFG